MARRKSKAAGAVTDIVSSLLLVGAAGVVVYLIYELAQTAPGNNAGLGPIGPLNQLDNELFPMNFPGGGEVPGTIETYTGALTQAITSPIATAETIVGINPENTPTK